MKATITRLAVVIAGAFGLAAPAHAQGANPRGVNPTHYQCYKIDAPAKPVTLKVLCRGTVLAGVTAKEIVISQPSKDAIAADLIAQLAAFGPIDAQAWDALLA